MSENSEKKANHSGQKPRIKYETNLLKYLWDMSYLNRDMNKSIPYFLNRVSILKNFSQVELYKLSKYLHLRHYSDDEIIFKDNDEAVGFYFVFDGEVDIYVQKEKFVHNKVYRSELKKDEAEEGPIELNINGRNYLRMSILKKYAHFGELGIFLEKSRRNVCAVARNETVLLGLLRPDLEMMIYEDSVIAAKILQSLGEGLAVKLKQILKEAGPEEL